LPTKLRSLILPKEQVFVVRQLYHFTGRFKSVHEMRRVLCGELDEVLPDEDSDYSVGYFEGRDQTKPWIVNTENFEVMYRLYKGEIFVV